MVNKRHYLLTFGVLFLIVTSNGFASEDQILKVTYLEKGEIQKIRSFFHDMNESIVNYHVDFQFDEYPLNEEYYPGGDYRNTITYASDWEMIDMMLEGLRSSYSDNASLDVFNSMYIAAKHSYDILDKERNKQVREDLSSFDGTLNYLYSFDDKIGTIATDESGRQVPQNPLLVYIEAVKILGNKNRYEILSGTQDIQENTKDNNSKSLYIFELLDSNKEYPNHVEKFLVDISNMHIIRRREYYGRPEQQTIQNQILYQDFSICDLGNTKIDLPKTITMETELVRGNGKNNNTFIFAKKRVLTLKNISAPKLTEQDSFKIKFPEGTRVWVKDGDYQFYAKGDGQIPPKYPPSLINKALPDFNDMALHMSPSEIQNRKVIVCFFDYEQRPSRNGILELSKRVQELKATDVEVIAVQASKTEKKTLDEWFKENNISIPVGMIENNEEQTRFNWGVRALPWLILTDKNHIVTAEGFSINELDEKIKLIK